MSWEFEIELELDWSDELLPLTELPLAPWLLLVLLNELRFVLLKELLLGLLSELLLVSLIEVLLVSPSDKVPDPLPEAVTPEALLSLMEPELEKLLLVSDREELDWLVAAEPVAVVSVVEVSEVMLPVSSLRAHPANIIKLATITANFFISTPCLF